MLDLSGLYGLDTPEDLAFLRNALVEDPDADGDLMVLALRGMSNQEQATALLLLSHFGAGRDALTMDELWGLAGQLEELLGASARPLRRLWTLLTLLQPKEVQA